MFRCRNLDWTFIPSIRISCSFRIVHVVRKPLRSGPIIAKHLCSSSTVSRTIVFFSVLLVDARRNSRAGLFSVSDKVIKFLKVRTSHNRKRKVSIRLDVSIHINLVMNLLKVIWNLSINRPSFVLSAGIGISSHILGIVKLFWNLSVSILGVFPCARHCSLKLSWFLTFCQ